MTDKTRTRPLFVPHRAHAEEVCKQLAKAPEIRGWETGYPVVEAATCGLYGVKLSSKPGDWHESLATE